MRFPPLSILLIAAIVACPLWCASGAANCCAEIAPRMSQRAVENSRCCRCCDVATNQHEHAPQDNAPEQPLQCQGICGGAVLEDSQPLVSDHVVNHPLAFDDLPIVASLVEPNDRVVGPIDVSGRNLGRSLRTLHASFLC